MQNQHQVGIITLSTANILVEVIGIMNDKEFKYEIKEHVQVLSQNARGWTKEVNLVSWNERAPKIDIREWNHDSGRMGKGVTLTEEETELLFKALKDRYSK